MTISFSTIEPIFHCRYASTLPTAALPDQAFPCRHVISHAGLTPILRTLLHALLRAEFLQKLLSHFMGVSSPQASRHNYLLSSKHVFLSLYRALTSQSLIFSESAVASVFPSGLNVQPRRFILSSGVSTDAVAVFRPLATSHSLIVPS